ncbi:HAMP domain-containing sensor histidine kinase [Psychrobacter sp. CAL346-MNA-CIBAN-0220]|uniref:sensor histidine kinase n=1 Tax=Psychrobacter sp. CAL346-MNA-CIBAN-0220 TaxID=3140457 RepID=UPI003332DF4C
MRTHSARTIPTLIRRSVWQAISLAVLIGFLLSFIYGFVYHYQQKRLYVQQLTELLASSGSTANGANLVARQVSTLLNSDSTLQNIVFYSTNYPINALNQETMGDVSSDWYNALFADTVNFNHTVTSHYLRGNSIQRANASQPISDPLSMSNIETKSSGSKPISSNTLVGYINITLDVNKMRWNWVRINLLSWLATVIVGIFGVWFILRKLNWPTRDVIELANVCDMAVNNAQLEKLPAIQQHFDFQELVRLKKAFIILFNRLKIVKQDYQALADFEQQLHNKDLSLDMQRHNFQSMITHELKTSLNAISGGLQLLDNQYLNEEQKDILAIIHKGSQQLELTLEQIIQLSKIEQGQIGISLSEFNPLQMITDLLEEFEPAAKQKNLALISRVQHVDYALEGDASKIKQVLATLIDNAIKFTNNGQVIIESQLMHFNESTRWQIKVIDTGIGIDPIYIEDVFTPFFQVDSSQTRAHEGLGIGLSVIKQIVQLMGASIELTSKLGAGSQFTILIPLRHRYQKKHQYLLQDVDILYYHYDDTDSMVEELQRLGADVTCQQDEQSLLDQIANTNVNVVMFAEEVLPEHVKQLALCIRAQETTSRSLLIYWYPPYKARYVDSFEYGLKAAGVDYCHSATSDSKILASLLRKWLVT